MDATPVVLLLVGLVFPIALVICAILFDVLVLMWAAHRVWHDRVVPGMSQFVMLHTTRMRSYRLLHR